MTWVDYALPIIIIVGLILAIICKATGQTLSELFRDLGDFFGEKKDEVEENTIGIYDR